MTIRERGTIPDELPPARLYFDDLEEIVKVFNECGSAVIQEPKVKFLVGRVECTELEELKTFGERTSKLEIEVSRDNELVGAK